MAVSARLRLPEADSVTASGYKRRQRGANVPRTDVSLARGETRRRGAHARAVDTADSMRDLLSGLQAGAERARAESSGTDNQEDAR